MPWSDDRSASDFSRALYVGLHLVIQCRPRRDRSYFNGQHLTVGDRQWTANDVSSSLMEINKMLDNMHYIVCWDDT